MGSRLTKAVLIPGRVKQQRSERLESSCATYGEAGTGSAAEIG